MSAHEAHADAATAAVLHDAATLVEIESPSSDQDATAACLQTFAAMLAERTGIAGELLEVDGHTHLRWSAGAPRVLLLGHLDTVWPHGTLARLPFRVDGDRATGPGLFDMKAGIAMALHVLGHREDLNGMAMLVTSDEEIGSPTSRRLIEDTAAGMEAVLVLEAGIGRAVKVGRKGVGAYRLAITGRAAHAGLEPHAGSNALIEAAHQVLAIAALDDPAAQTTVTPTVARAGTTMNTVPAEAQVDVDTRAWSPEEQQRVDTALRALAPQVQGTTLTWHGGINRPPLTSDATAGVFARARAVAEHLHLPPLEAARVGGGSDGNFTGAMGVPTLDGLGAVGGGAHAEDEHVLVSALADRVRLLDGLCTDLLATPLTP